MAAREPSFRFATPRIRDRTYTAGPASLLPTRSNASDNVASANSSVSHTTPVLTKKMARATSKSQRTNISEAFRPREDRVTSKNNQRVNVPAVGTGNSAQSSISTLASTNTQTSAVAPSRIARPPYQPHTPESVECVINPNPSSVPSSSLARPGNLSSKTLRRKPSVIGKFMLGRRNITSPSADSIVVSANVEPEELPVPSDNNTQEQYVENAQPRQLEPPFSGPPSRPATAGTDSRKLNYASTPVSELSTTPSLRHTESSGGFSRAVSTTPTSQISYSPMISQSPHFGPGAWNSPRKNPRDVYTGAAYTPPIFPFQSSSSLGNESNPPSVREPAKPVPELAHLAHDPTPYSASARKPPKRPSRDNTPTIDTTDFFTPVVYSDLPPTWALQHGRKSSASAPVSASQAAQKEEWQAANLMPEHTAQSADTSSSLSERPTSPRKPTNSADQNRSTVSSPPVSDSNKSHSRFGFFSRKEKAKPAPSSDATTKQSKKGPMAGTGHEAYGKFAPSGRNNNIASTVSSANQTNNKSTTALSISKVATSSGASDPTAPPDGISTDQCAPVYLHSNVVGKEGDNRITVGNDSTSSLTEDEVRRNSTVSSPKTSSGSYSSIEAYRSSAKTSGIPLSASTSISSRAASSRGRGSWGSTSRGPNRRAPKENSKSMSRREEDLKISEPPRGRRSLDAEAETDTTADANTKKSNWSMFVKSAPKTKASQKWNPFQRSQSLPPSEDARRSAKAVDDTVPVPPRSIAHYEIVDDNPRTHFDLKELNDLMEEADGVQSEYQSDADEVQHGLAVSRPLSHGKSVIYNETAQILTSHLKLSPELYGERVQNGSENDIPADERVPEEPPQTTPVQPRRSRLAQVGRIPKVISTRDLTAQKAAPAPKPATAQSFSRPFGVTQNRPIVTPSYLSSVLTGSSTSLTSQSLLDRNSGSAISRSSTQNDDQTIEGEMCQLRDTSPEFFSMRKNSDHSYSSSSGNFYFPSAALTAVVPLVGSPASEDEVWQEYDELIDNVLTPVVSANSKNGAPKEMTKSEYLDYLAPAEASNDESIALSGTALPKLGDMASTLRSDLSPFVGTLRRSQIFSGFELPEISPAPSAVDPDDEGERTITLADQNETSMSMSQPNESQTKQPGPNSNFDQSKSKGTEICANDAEFMKLTPKSMANLRFAALMTSKWLSFGRVLFSPAHYDLVESSDDRVLVIDGLGTDWSYFTALTYPNLTVYSFGPGSVQDPEKQTKGPWQPLANHRHFSHSDMTSNFPFPKNFFAVVVFRFPAATSEAKTRMTLSECKRVLQPGGYLEVSSLDLDLTNMGNKARRAIRTLKTQMQDMYPDVCLKPASDNVQSLLGRRGFENLNRCVLGVPAAGVIGESRTNSLNEQEMTFTKLIEDQSEAGDDVMTKMVARVGRWWYLKTYEMCALPNGDVAHSIWNDMALLRECEKNETAFKLFICYAQKPTITKRRTVSL